MTVADPEQKRLTELASTIEAWQEWILTATQSGTIDREVLDRTHETVDRLATLDDDLHEEDFDPKALATIRHLIIQLMRASNDVNESNAFDTLDEALVLLEGMRHIVRDALDWHVSGLGADSRPIVVDLYETLPNVKKQDIATLTGYSPRQLQRLAKDGGTPSRQLELTARLVKLLARGWTDEGVLAWFSRPRDELGGRPPAELLDDPAFERTLLIAAKQGRAFHGG